MLTSVEDSIFINAETGLPDPVVCTKVKERVPNAKSLMVVFFSGLFCQPNPGLGFTCYMQCQNYSSQQPGKTRKYNNLGRVKIYLLSWLLVYVQLPLVADAPPQLEN